jgi:hypothetical protein
VASNPEGGESDLIIGGCGAVASQIDGAQIGRAQYLRVNVNAFGMMVGPIHQLYENTFSKVSLSHF